MKRWRVLTTPVRPIEELDREVIALASIVVGWPLPGATNILKDETYARYEAGMNQLGHHRRYRRQRKFSFTADLRVVTHYRGWMNAMQAAGGWQLLTTTRASRAKRARHAARPNGRRNR